MEVEICLDSVASAQAAEAGGADRVELCANLVEGGTTPSYGMIKQVKEKCGLRLMVIIRPRGGDFLYDESEKQVCLDEIEAARELGVDGVVIGALNKDATIDKEFTRQMLERAQGMEVTFHRAFDMTVDLRTALEELIELGVSRVLTSGGRANVYEGADVIAALVKQAAGRISIMPGGGVAKGDIAALVAKTGVKEVHTSASTEVFSKMEVRNDGCSMGSASEGREYVIKVTDEALVRQIVSAAKG